MTRAYIPKYRPRQRATVRFGAYEVAERFFAAFGRCISITQYDADGVPLHTSQISQIPDHRAAAEWDGAIRRARYSAILDAMGGKSNEQR